MDIIGASRHHQMGWAALTKLRHIGRGFREPNHMYFRLVKGENHFSYHQSQQVKPDHPDNGQLVTVVYFVMSKMRFSSYSLYSTYVHLY